MSLALKKWFYFHNLSGHKRDCRIYELKLTVYLSFSLYPRERRVAVAALFLWLKISSGNLF